MPATLETIRIRVPSWPFSSLSELAFSPSSVFGLGLLHVLLMPVVFPFTHVWVSVCTHLTYDPGFSSCFMTQITRKDKLCENIFRMKQLFGARHFDFIPETYILPQEVSDFASTFSKGELSPLSNSEGTHEWGVISSFIRPDGSCHPLSSAFCFLKSGRPKIHVDCQACGEFPWSWHSSHHASWPDSTW